MLCNAYLLEGAMSGRTLPLGEVAHIVGQSTDPRSPRGADPMEKALRDDADNLMLLCAQQHMEIDAKAALDVFTVEWLRGVKQEHEDRVRHLTALGPERATTVVRMVGSVHGNSVELSRETAAKAVTAGHRFPLYLESYTRHGVEIDLRHTPGEQAAAAWDAEPAAEASRHYYRQATKVIDDVVQNRLRPGIECDSVQHVSVFGFARLPLLVYLGSLLDDTVPTDVFQRHRHEQSWVWPAESGPVTEFAAHPVQTGPDGDEAVVVVNVSGVIAPYEIPQELSALRRYEVSPVGAQAGPDILRCRASLRRLEETVRMLLARLEREAKSLRRLHVLPAVPLSAAVALGRAHHPQVHPQLVIYERLAGSYVPTLEVGQVRS
ncbi:SAVED domain-containing protein [Streptomyces sp. NBC_01242]|uniref:SAVED domain-containing protein n=1 Tax=Streptomyces sp. NBC_01242 TaxID=2903795 RepID=UPI00224D6DD8|nr:SAVED domain-containing protein [Streptomyces sp. NBC_01242]MCX4797637.1 SAVED domain-containing protein [Streptomyces sp. NBC_01242]